MTIARILVPKAIRKGDIVTLKAILSHPMETGYRREINGAVIARDIVRRFSCSQAGEIVFAAEFFPAIAANPFVAFTLVAGESGPLVFEWQGDHGFVHRETVMLTVEG